MSKELTPIKGKIFDPGVSGLPKVIPNDEVPMADKKRLNEAKIRLISRFPFIGFLVMSIEWYFSPEETLPTLCASELGGRNRVFINAAYFESLSLPQRCAALAHEAHHIFLGHVGRARQHSYYPALWNIATDFVINGMLFDLHCPDIQLRLNDGDKSWLYDHKYCGWSADAVYFDLLKEHKNNPQAAVLAYGEGSGKGSAMDWVSTEMPSDGHKMRNKQIVGAAINSTSQSAGEKQYGEGEANMMRAFEKILDVHIAWHSELAQYVTATAKNRYTYNRINRRSTGRVVFPTQTGDHINLVFATDTSGSMGEADLKECMEKLYGIMTDFDSWECTALSCDTEVHEMGTYNSEEGDDISVIDFTKLIGGGGTDMNPIIEYVNKMDEAPAVLIICTDGFVPEITAIEDVPVVFVVTTNGNKDFRCENAKVIQMTKDDKEYQVV